MKLLILTIALTLVSPQVLSQSTARGDVDWAERFAPMQWLTKRCWKATFPDGVTTDQHCFGYQYGDKFIRDSHVVTGPNPTYRGETLYAWTLKANRSPIGIGPILEVTAPVSCSLWRMALCTHQSAMSLKMAR